MFCLNNENNNNTLDTLEDLYNAFMLKRDKLFADMLKKIKIAK
jgi:hypothetical protein